jgi:hypothetical protein
LTGAAGPVRRYETPRQKGVTVATDALREVVHRIVVLPGEDVDTEFVERFIEDPEALLASYPLAPQERAALLARDAVALASLGLNPVAADVLVDGVHQGASTACSQTCTKREEDDPLPEGCLSDSNLWE